jgi:alpha-tubulin suppressor-like RCC1 family protein
VRSVRALSTIVGIGCAVAASMERQASPPVAPANLWAAQTSAREITLVWSRVPGAVQYRIFEGTGASAKRLGWTTASGEQYVRPISGYGIEHRFSIDAVFENGDVSPRAAFNPVVPREVTPAPVAAPATVTATAGKNGISLTWDAVPGVSAYRIGRQMMPGGVQILCRLCPTVPTFLDATAQSGARVVYVVTAVAPSGVSRAVRSNQLTATTDPALTRDSATGIRVEPDNAPPRGTITVPPVPGGCLSIGEQGNMIVRLADGTVRYFERINFGGGEPASPTPGFRPVPGITNAVAVATSGRHSLVLIGDGTLRAFGMNDRGQLGQPVGYGDTPVVAVRGITNAVAIAVGQGHSAALLADGTIRMWGAGENGIPGDGRADVTTNRTAPARVAGITNAKAIASGVSMTLALTDDGRIRAWGSNFGGLGFYGVLGTGERGLSSATPQPVIGIANAVAIATSGVSSLAVLADGRVMAWGAARSPRRDLPEDYLRTTNPLPVPDIVNALAVSPHLILLADGTVRELFRPEEAVAGITHAVAVASDPTNKYALLSDGRLVGWGLKQFWPRGRVTVAEFGRQDARECAFPHSGVATMPVRN